MGEAHLLGEGDLGAPPVACGRSGPLADPVHGEDGGFLEGRGVEGARGVGEVVLAKEDLLGLHAQLVADQALDPEFVEQPVDHCLAEDTPASRDGLEGGEQNALEFDEGLFVEDEIVEVTGVDASGLETKSDGVGGKAAVVLEAAEALLLGGGDELTVAYQCRCRVVVIARDAEDVHATALPSYRSNLRKK